MTERIGQEGVVHDNYKAGTRNVTQVKFDKDAKVMGLYETSLELVGEALTSVEQYKKTVLEVALKWYKKAEWCIDDFREALGELGLSIPGYEFLHEANDGTMLMRQDGETVYIIIKRKAYFEFFTNSYESSNYSLDELVQEVTESEWRDVKTDKLITIGLPA